MKKLRFWLMLFISINLTFSIAWAKEIKIGVLSDLSGPTSAVGRSYAKGVMDCIKYLNSKGGINGYKIKAIQVDYAYNAQQAISAYKRFVKKEHIVALQGWGTQDTEALTRFVARDKIPTFSASYSAHLTNPKKAPFNFFIAADYSTQLRAALKFFKDNWKQKRAPRIAFIYPDHPYGLAPIPAAKNYAQKLGYEIVGEENVSLKAIDATTQLLSLKKKNPDYVWIGGTTPSTAVILKDAKKLNFHPVFFVNIWGGDENLIKLAGNTAEGVYSLQAAAIYGQDVPGMKIIKQITQNKPQMTHYIRGFASMLVMAKGIEMAAKEGKISGPRIKQALENLRNFNPLGLTPPISYFPDDHRPNMSVFIYKIEKGKFKFIQQVNLKRKKEWLGK
ncbi:branched-chain amino acid transport system substrate-binding protein [Desulfonauticus submarinus]|uniref:Branched-chain amino acid transport system substrate-binding protein n=1 Tax=Desulfonauticus submarinus TaxID=206665 RepID=A0A1G9ZRI8_9BACT|nr:ABC transporter substrate-binding protein [Desulfonauticus submarinus]SDN24009.1 branched-chain amino acid transport system substrate-binding protein [Desulfonauticus submarinus]